MPDRTDGNDFPCGNGKRKERKQRADGQGAIYRRGHVVGAAYVLMPDGTRRRRPRLRQDG